MPVARAERACEMAALLSVRTNQKRHEQFSSMSRTVEGEAAMSRMPKYAAKADGCVRTRKTPSRFRTCGRFARYHKRLRAQQAEWMRQDRLGVYA